MRRSPPRPRKQYTVGEQIFGYGCLWILACFGTLVVIFYTLADLVIRFLKSPITWIVAGIVAGIVVIVVVGYNLYIHNEKRINKIFLSESAFRKKYISEKNYSGGEHYIGETKEYGLRDGQGTFTWANGNQYIGEHKHGKFHGQGTFTYTNGNQYIGEFKDDKRTQGTFTWPDGAQYIGKFKDGKRTQGTFTWPDGNQYIGELKDNKFHGQGTFTFSDGEQYIGEHKDGKFHGQGTFTYSDGTSDKGIWEDDEYIG